jgi:hypothetical protein
MGREEHEVHGFILSVRQGLLISLDRFFHNMDVLDLLDLSLTCVSCVLDTMPRVQNYFWFMGWIFCINFYADFSFLVSFRIGWGDRKSIEN